MLAFRSLQIWVQGFIKNSKGRETGKGVFIDNDERRDYSKIRTWYNALKRSSSVESAGTYLPSSRVSVISWLSVVCYCSWDHIRDFELLS